MNPPSQLFEAIDGDARPELLAAERWQLCNDAVVLATAPLTVRMPQQRWTYGLLLPLDHAATPEETGVVIRLHLAVRNGTVGVAGVSAGLEVLTTPEQFVSDAESAVTMRLDRAAGTIAIVLRNASADGRSPELTLLGASASGLPGLRLAPRLHDLPHDLFVILSMPKTATQTVERTILAIDPAVPVRRIHFISSRSISYVRGDPRAAALPPALVESTLRQATTAEETRREIELMRRLGGRVAIISGIREPIDQVISSTFQSLPDTIPAFALFRESGPALLSLLREFVLVQLWHAAADLPPWGSPRAFFRDELMPLAEIDISSRPFDRGSGFVRVEHGKTTLMVYRCENAQIALGPALSAVTGRAAVAVTVTNEAATKPYADLYREFRAGFRVPADLCARLYDEDPIVRHFYSEAEIAAFKAHWSGALPSRSPRRGSAVARQLSIRKVVVEGPGIISEMDRYRVSERVAFDPAAGVLVVMDPWSHHPVPGHLERIRTNMRTSLLPLLAIARAAGLQISYHPTAGDIDPLVAPHPVDWVIDWQHYDQADGDELGRRCATFGKTQLLYAGYTANMCVLNKPAGVLAMARKGFREIILVRDATIGSEMPETLGNESFKEWALFEVERKYGSTTTIADLRACLAETP